jgi:FkbM family methyltransferase
MHCFEPFPALADFLIELVRRNSFTDVCINNLLASESDGAVELFFQEGATDTASSVRGFQQSFNSSLTTQRCSLDSYFESRQLDKLTLIKIDVEGGELEVLRGARRLIRETQPIIILELLYTSKSEHLIRQEETIAILKEMNYKFFPIRGNGRWEEQISVRPDPTYKFPNYLVCKNDPC